ncbi:MAG: demethoxyubiquinone hydroxylase family protein, partial [Steroidobacteraceae bacterium]
MNAPAPDRVLDPMDRLLDTLDRGLRTLFAHPRARRPNPAGARGTDDLAEADKARVVGLIRVDHAGEIAAQGLYHGQALTARTPALAD